MATWAAIAGASSANSSCWHWRRKRKRRALLVEARQLCSVEMFSLKLPVLDSGHASKHRTDCPVLSPRDVSQVTDFSVDLCLKCCRAHSLPRCPARPNSRPLAQGHRPAIVWLLRYGSNQEDSSNANENLYCARDASVMSLCLCLCLTFLASTMSYAQVPAESNRPAGVPDGYVITPFGYFHPSCVLRLAQGETLLADGRVLQHADGTLENIPACEYPHYAASGAIAAAGAAKAESPTINGWVESSSVMTNSTSY